MSTQEFGITPEPPTLNIAAIGWAGAFVFTCIVVIFLGFIAVDSRRRLYDAERRADREKQHADRAWELIFRLRSVDKPRQRETIHQRSRRATDHVVPLITKGADTE